MLRPKREKEGEERGREERRGRRGEERRGGGEERRGGEGERRGGGEGKRGEEEERGREERRRRGEERKGEGGGRGLSLPCKMIVSLCQGPAGAKGGGRRFLQQLHPQPTQPLHPVLLGNTSCGRPRLQQWRRIGV